MWGQSILRPLFLRVVVGGFLFGALYAGARYGSPVSGGLAGAFLLEPAVVFPESRTEMVLGTNLPLSAIVFFHPDCVHHKATDAST